MAIFNRKKTRAKRNESAYRRWLKRYQPNTTKQRIQVLKIFEDRQGNNYYVPRNHGNITRERAIKIEECITAITYGVKPGVVQQTLSDIKQGFSDLQYKKPTPSSLKKLQKDSINAIDDLLYRMDNIQPESLMIEAALYMIYTDNENPYLIENDVQDMKRDRINSDEELRAFFLDFIEVVLKSSNNGEKEDSQN